MGTNGKKGRRKGLVAGRAITRVRDGMLLPPQDHKHNDSDCQHDGRHQVLAF